MSLGIRGVLSLACVGHLLRTACSQYSYDYSTTNYYDDYQLYQAGYQYDDDMDDGFQYNPYSGSYDDVYGDYYFDDEHEQLSDCRIEEGGKPKFNGRAFYGYPVVPEAAYGCAGLPQDGLTLQSSHRHGAVRSKAGGR